MIITQARIKKLMPCENGWEWYLKHPEKDLLTLLLKLPQDNPDWAAWLFTHLMTHRQCVQLAVFLAELVIGIYEEDHPDDKRPRISINAAKDWLDNPTPTTAKTAYSAYAVAHIAAHTAEAAQALHALHAAQASYAVADAISAAANGEYEIQVKIFKEAVRILEDTA